MSLLICTASFIPCKSFWSNFSLSLTHCALLYSGCCSFALDAFQCTWDRHPYNFPCLVSETQEASKVQGKRESWRHVWLEIARVSRLFLYPLLPDPCKFRAQKQHSVKDFQLSSKHPCISFPFPFFFWGDTMERFTLYREWSWNFEIVYTAFIELFFKTYEKICYQIIIFLPAST